MTALQSPPSTELPEDVRLALDNATAEASANPDDTQAGSRARHLPVRWAPRGDGEVLETRAGTVLARITVAPKVYPPLYKWRLEPTLCGREAPSDWDFDLDRMRSDAATAFERFWERQRA